MSDITTISIDVYPWAVPTAEQKAWFDSLSVEEKTRVLEEAIEEGFNSGPAEDFNVEEFIAEAKAEIKGENAP